MYFDINENVFGISTFKSNITITGVLYTYKNNILKFILLSPVYMSENVQNKLYLILTVINLILQ